MSTSYSYAPEVRAIRRRLSLTISDLSQILAVDHRQINRWEGGSAPTPAGVIDALQILERRMLARVDARARALAGATHLVMYRDRAELVAAEPFYRELPSALHEWEIAQLQARLSLPVVYSDAWQQSRRPRSPFTQPVSAPSLEPGEPGLQRLRPDARLPERVRRLIDGRLSPGFAHGVTDAIAFAQAVPTDELADLHLLEQPWEGGPSVELILDNASDVDLYVVPRGGSTVALEVAAYRDRAGHHHVIGELPHARLPWLMAAS